MIFNGLEPLRHNEGTIEVRSSERRIDLHNYASFIGFRYRFPETVTLSFDYDAGGDHETKEPPQLVELKFEGVSNFRAGLLDWEHKYEGETLREIVYGNLGAGRGVFEVIFEDGFILSFEAGSVSLEVTTTPDWSSDLD